MVANSVLKSRKALTLLPMGTWNVNKLSYPAYVLVERQEAYIVLILALKLVICSGHPLGTGFNLYLSKSVSYPRCGVSNLRSSTLKLCLEGYGSCLESYATWSYATC